MSIKALVYWYSGQLKNARNRRVTGCDMILRDDALKVDKIFLPLPSLLGLYKKLKSCHESGPLLPDLLSGHQRLNLAHPVSQRARCNKQY